MALALHCHHSALLLGHVVYVLLPGSELYLALLFDFGNVTICRGHAVTQLIEALCNKPVGRGLIN